MSVLVTGGAGFIGLHVVDRLVAEGQRVVVLDNLDPQVHGPGGDVPAALAGHMASGAVDFVRGDVLDRVAVDKALAGIDSVVHLAAAVGVGQSMYQPDYYTSVNTHGQSVLLSAMIADPGRFRRLVVASSMSIYGEGAYRCERDGIVAPGLRAARQLADSRWDPVCPLCGGQLEPALTTEVKPTQTTSVYAITKKTQEDMALCLGGAYSIPTYALRFFNTYGSRQALSNPYTGVAAIFLSRLKNGMAPLLYEDGLQTRDFVHVADVSRAVVCALDTDAGAAPPGAYNVCTGKPVSIGGIAETLAARLKVGVAPKVINRARSGDIRHCVGDPALTAKTLGFSASVSLDEGLEELIAWSRDAHAEDRVEDSFRLLEARGLVS